jgi:hypothetical protein
LSKGIDVAGAVYFARCGDRVKIGFSIDPQARLGILQSGNPEPLTLVGWMPGTQDSERNLHQQFSALHVRGEWFRAEPALLEFIASVTPGRLPDGASFNQPPARVDGPECWPKERGKNLVFQNHLKVRIGD